MRLYAAQPIGTVPRARRLRREAPEPERRVLRALRETFPELKWRHQAPVGPFYADVLCFSEKLVIEVDGDSHVGNEARDSGRAEYMTRQGYRTLRLSNADVMGNAEGAVAQVTAHLREKGGTA